MLPKDFYENVPSRCVKECGLNADDIFISIAIPTYKRTDLLEQAINSALNQDVTWGGVKYEIVVVSNDPSADLSHFIEKYKNFDNISFYVNAENLGLAGNMNRGAMLAHGKFVAYLHDDDLLKPNYIQEISKILLDEKYNDALCILNSFEFIQFDGTEIKYENTELKQGALKIFAKTFVRKILEAFINLAFKFHNFKFDRKDIVEITPEIALHFMPGSIYMAPSCGTVFNREKFFEAGGWSEEGEMSYDLYSFLRFNEQFKIYKIKEALGIYRNGVNISSLRSTRINFCRNDFALLDRKCKDEKSNQIKKYLRLRFMPHDERDEVYRILNLKPYTPSFLELLLYRIKNYWFIKSHNLDYLLNIKGI